MRLFYELDGQSLWIDLPMSVNEIAFSSFCDFRTDEDRYFQFMRDGDHEAAVVSFVETLSTMVDGDLQSLPLATHAKEFDERVEAKKLIVPGDDLTLNAIYAHLHVLMNTYTPESIPKTFTLTKDGIGFEVTKGKAAAMVSNTPLTTGEVLETLEYQRRSLTAKDTLKLATGNIDFTLGLTEFAILVRKPGEKLPRGKKLERFIAQRMEIFKTLPLNLVFDLRFFLINSLLEYGSGRKTGSSLKGRRRPAKRKPKHSAKRKPKRK